MSTPIRVAVVGLGKIAHDQHLPALAQDEDFQLVAAASPEGSAPGVPVLKDLPALLGAGIPLDAVVLSQPPQYRSEAARRALEAGLHVLLEKPPATHTREMAELAALAAQVGRTLFTAWHSRHAAAVAPAREWLVHRGIRGVRIQWLEDVRRWHPGQAWIWESGGLGVFDPGINALSILTHLVPQRLLVRESRLLVPDNRAMPIAAHLRLGTEAGPGFDLGVEAQFDWRHTGTQCWSIRIETDEGVLQLDDGGARMSLDGAPVPVVAMAEYPALYRRFAELVRGGRSEIDAEPLRLTEEAFAGARVERVAPFLD